MAQRFLAIILVLLTCFVGISRFADRANARSNHEVSALQATEQDYSRIPENTGSNLTETGSYDLDWRTFIRPLAKGDLSYAISILAAPYWDSFWHLCKRYIAWNWPADSMITMKNSQGLLGIIIVGLTCFVGISTFDIYDVFARYNPKEIALQATEEDSSSIPEDTGFNLTEAGSYDLAWRTFIALNWPADPRCNGDAADANFAENSYSHRVWECYESVKKIYIPNPETPNPEVELRLGEESKELQRKILNRLPLVDQSGNYVLNEIHINPAEEKQIQGNGWFCDSEETCQAVFGKYTTNKSFALICNEGGSYQGEYPCLENLEREGPGAIEIKVAWMVLESPSKDEKQNNCRPLEFTGYKTTRTLQVLGEDGNIVTRPDVPVGLVGFHIVQKTSNTGWIWSTFEHEKNAPDRGEEVDPGVKYNFYGSKCEEYLGKQCKENLPYVKSPYLWSNQCPHAVTKSARLVGAPVTANFLAASISEKDKPQIPSQITRVIPILERVEEANQEWHDKIRNEICLEDSTCSSIWTQYKLIGTQWLLDPTNPETSSVLPSRPKGEDRTSKLANVALEHYVQARPDLDGQSCVSCHLKAKLPNREKKFSDFSFVFKYLANK